MLGTPKKGRRFGGDSAHQKAMMGNLVASLIAAEYLVTTEAKAKALRPVAEKVHHRRGQGRRGPPAERGRLHPGQGHGPQAVRGDRPRDTPNGPAATPGSSSWATGWATTPRWPASNWCEPAPRARGSTTGRCRAHR